MNLHSVCKGAFASVILACLALSGTALADSQMGLAGDGFHCPGDVHAIRDSITSRGSCSGESAILLSRQPRDGLMCGSCLALTVIQASYSSTAFVGDTAAAGLFELGGNNYFNGDENGPNNGLRRNTNAAFCDDWFGGNYNATTRTCECDAGQRPLGNHGGCAVCDTTVPTDVQQGNRSCPGEPTHFSFGDGAQDGRCGTILQCINGELPGRLFGGSPFAGLLGECSCNTNWDLLHCDSEGCIQNPNCGTGATVDRDAPERCSCSGANQVLDSNKNCVCEAGYGEGIGGNCVEFPTFSDCPVGEINVGGNGLPARCVPNCSPERRVSGTADADNILLNMGEALYRPWRMAIIGSATDEQITEFYMSSPDACLTAFECTDTYNGAPDAEGERCVMPQADCTPVANDPGCRCTDPNVIINGVCTFICLDAPNSITEDCECPSATHFTDTSDNSCHDRRNCGQDQIYNAANNTCSDRAECTENQERADNNECVARVASDCPDNREFVPAGNSPSDGGVCRQCAENSFSSQGSACVSCASPLQFIQSSGTCICPPSSHFGDVSSCVPHVNCPNENEIRSTELNVCVCTGGLGRVGGACVECTGGKTSPDGLACACPQNLAFENPQGVCEESLESTCHASEEYSSETNTCACPADFPRSNEDGVCVACHATRTYNATDNTCDCPSDRTFETPNGACEVNLAGTCESPRAYNDTENTCDCPANLPISNSDGSCTTGCESNQKLLNGECTNVAAGDCLDAEVFRDGACRLPEPGEWQTRSGTIPPYSGSYDHEDCTDANWPWSIVQTADGLSELCHAPVRVLATEAPSSQTLDSAGDMADFCVLRGATSGDSLRCDDPTIFASLGIPNAPEGLVRQITTTMAVTLSDGSTRFAESVTAEVQGYLEAVHISGTVAAILPPNTEEAQITATDPLVGTTFVVDSTNTVSVVTPPSPTNTVAPPAPAAGGGGGGGGGGAAAALIAVPVVLLGGYWLLGGFEYIHAVHNLEYAGENSDFTYRGDAGFELNHGNLNSYARAIQSNGGAVAYQSGISYKEDFYNLNYTAYESKSVYDYDLSARLNYGEGTWSISPTADAEFNYSTHTEDWTSEAGAGLTAAWTSHKWNIRAHSAFAGDLNHGLDVEFRF